MIVGEKNVSKRYIGMISRIVLAILPMLVIFAFSFPLSQSWDIHTCAVFYAVFFLITALYYLTFILITWKRRGKPKPNQVLLHLIVVLFIIGGYFATALLFPEISRKILRSPLDTILFYYMASVLLYAIIVSIKIIICKVINKLYQMWR